MLSAVVVLIFVAGFGLQQYLKGGIAKAYILFVSAIIAMAVSFGFYELVGSFGKGFLGDTAYAAAFGLLFMFAMILISELVKRIVKEEIDLGLWPNRIGGLVFGALTGLLCSSMMLMLLGLLPYGFTKYAYARFEDNISNPPKAQGALLGADALAPGLFSYMSKSSFAGASNFAVVNAEFPDKVFLNKYFATAETSSSLHARDEAISVEPNAVVRAGEKLRRVVDEKSTKTEPVETISGKTLYIISAQLNSSALEIAEDMSSTNVGLGQIRLITVPKGNTAETPGVSGKVAYPAGFINSNGLLQTGQLTDTIATENVVKLAFYVPVDQDPAVLEVKLNSGVEVRPPAAAATPTKQ